MLRILQVVGVIFVVLGALLFIAPLLLERLPSLERMPSIIIYVYRRNGFTFVTSPILIIISFIFLI